MRRMFQWALTSALICGASVFTACTSSDDTTGMQGVTWKKIQ